MVCVYGYNDIEAAITQLNALPYAFPTAVFTDRMSMADHWVEALATSAVAVNDHTAFSRRSDTVRWTP